MVTTRSNMRRAPKQERSRERVDEILGAAKRLIGEKGIDAVKMREIAALAGGPISSVYQYFPNKSAIIATLYDQWAAALFDMMEAKLVAAGSLDELFVAVTQIFDAYFDRIRSDPSSLDLLNAIQADKALKNIDISETRRQVQLFCSIARPWIDSDRFEAFSRVSFLMFQLANGAVRLALAVGEEEAPLIIEDYKSVIRTQLWQFARAS